MPWPWTSNRSNNGYRLLQNQDNDDDELLDDSAMLSQEAVIEGPANNLRGCGCCCKSRFTQVLVCICIICGISTVSISLGWYSWFGLPTQPVIDKSIDAFSIPNHEAYKRYDSLMIALRNGVKIRKKRDVSKTVFENSKYLNDEHNINADLRKKRSAEKRCAIDSQSIPRWKMHLVYLAKGDGDHNMFTKERLELVHQVEQMVISHPKYSKFCYKEKDWSYRDPAVAANQGCAPLNSLMTYFFPTKNNEGQIHYDGLGSHIDDVDSALKYAMNYDTFYYFVDEKINRTYPKSRLLRTEVLFGAPLPDFNCFGDMGKQSEMFKEFEITYIEVLSKVSTDKVQVLYGGNELFDYEIDSTFWSDITMAAYSLGSIFFIMFMLTSFSPWLTICGIWTILLSFPVAIFFYRVVFKINALGILNGAAAFVIIGIGVDDVFVFINIFHQSSHQKLWEKIKYTIMTAGKATFFTSFTTAAAFAANMASSIPAVYEFGLFMSLIVSCCWISVIIMMPPTLYIWQVVFSKCEMRCYKCCDYNKWNDIESESSTQTSSLSDSTDVPMLPIDDGGIATFDAVESVDDAMLSLEPVFEQSSQPPQYQSTEASKPGSNIGRYLQAFLYKYIAPVITHSKGKWIVIGSYVCIFLTSVGLLTQLRPASHPPQLFHPDTNLQQLLDLKANFSILDNLQCYRCSGLYSQSKHISPATDRTPVRPFPIGTSPLFPEQPTTPKPSFTTTVKTTTLKPTYAPATTTNMIPPSTTTIPPTTTTIPPTTTTITPTTTTPKKVTSGMRRHPIIPPVSHHKPRQPVNTDKAHSVSVKFDACKDNSCNNLKDRPKIQMGTTVYVVFGIKGLILPEARTGHVINEKKGTVEYNNDLPKAFKSGQYKQIITDLCKICHLIANNTELVKNGSAQCIPHGLHNRISSYLRLIKECRNLPQSIISYRNHRPDHAVGGFTKHKSLKWLGFAFESTTSKGDAYFSAYHKYLAWNKFIDHIRDDVLSKDSPLQDVFQTSEFWKKVMMEVVAVYSAIYGLVLSLAICIIAVAIFTGHISLLLIVLFTIVAMICCVVGLFYLAGWEMGAIEAISLSILVGSSVDYCVHLVEGYIIAGKTINMDNKKNPELRKQRTIYALRHIGVAIISSAITTIIAAIPLTQTVIQPFSKFGDILLINTSISIIFTITLCASLLSAIGPAKYKATFKSTIKALIVTCVCVGVLVLIIFGVSKTIYPVPGPNGNPLFP